MRRSQGGAAAAFACALAALVLAGSAAPAPERPNLVVVTLDTTRRDHTSIGGSVRDTTPRLARLAQEGVRFDAAYAPASSTGPSHATLFTGRYPITHGVRANGVPLAADARTLAERLSDAGYDTAGFISSFVLTHQFGFDQGFALWDADFPVEGSTSHPAHWEGHEVGGGFDRRGDATTDRAIRWLEQRKDPRPFFLFVHYFDAHAPYAPPEGALHFPPDGEGALAADVAAYDSEIHFADAQLARLLDALDRLKLAPHTLVAVTADHGEGLMQHGLMGHGLQVYEEQVRIPMVFRMPGVLPAGSAIGAPIEMVDVAPTLLDLLGVPQQEIGGVGRSLAAALRGGPALPADHPVYLYRRQFLGEKRGDLTAQGEKFGVREGKWKYIVGPEEKTSELFDLDSDPGEKTNVYRADDREAERLAARIARWRAAYDKGGAVPALSDEARKGLEALGYVQ